MSGKTPTDTEAPPPATGKVVSLPGTMTIVEVANYLLENRHDIAGLAVVCLYNHSYYGVGIAGMSPSETHLAGGILQGEAISQIVVDGEMVRDGG